MFKLPQDSIQAIKFLDDLVIYSFIHTLENTPELKQSKTF